MASLHVKFTYTLLQLYNLYTYSYIEHRERDSQESESAIESSTSSSPSLFFSKIPLPQEEERIQTHKIQNKPSGRGTSPERDVNDPGVCGDRASYSVSFCVREHKRLLRALLRRRRAACGLIRVLGQTPSCPSMDRRERLPSRSGCLGEASAQGRVSGGALSISVLCSTLGLLGEGGRSTPGTAQLCAPHARDPGKTVKERPADVADGNVGRPRPKDNDVNDDDCPGR